MKDVLILSNHSWLFPEVTELINTEFKEFSSRIQFIYSPPGKPLLLDTKTEWHELIKQFNYIFSLHWQQIFPKELVEGTLCINIHPGYNPYNRGWFPHVFSLVNGLPIGATIHIMDDQIDHGNIIDRALLEVKPYETSKEIYENILKLELGLFKKHFISIITNNYKTFIPEIEGNLNKKRDYKKLCKINQSEVGTFGEFINRLRALTHGDYKNAYFLDKNGKKIFLQLILTSED